MEIHLNSGDFLSFNLPHVKRHFCHVFVKRKSSGNDVVEPSVMDFINKPARPKTGPVRTCLFLQYVQRGPKTLASVSLVLFKDI
jgi:hypothetical protein